MELFLASLSRFGGQYYLGFRMLFCPVVKEEASSREVDQEVMKRRGGAVGVMLGRQQQAWG